MTRLILYNIEYCEGLNGTKLSYLKFWRYLFSKKKIEHEIVKKLLKLNPDIIALNEIDSGSLRTGNKNQIDYFKDKLNMKYCATRTKYQNKGVGRLLCELPIYKNLSNAIISKEKLSKIKYLYFKKGIKRLIIEAQIKEPKKTTLILVHMALKKGTRKKQITELTNRITKIKCPVILMGDFNTSKGDKEIEELIKKTNLKLNKKVKTYPSVNPKKTLDYVLTSKEIIVKKYKSLPLTFSDHRPILVDFEIKSKNNQKNFISK